MSKTKICPNCHERIDESAKYCAYCGFNQAEDGQDLSENFREGASSPEQNLQEDQEGYSFPNNSPAAGPDMDRHPEPKRNVSTGYNPAPARTPISMQGTSPHPRTRKRSVVFWVIILLVCAVGWNVCQFIFNSGHGKLNDPATYVAASDLYMTYHEKYYDGEEAELESYTAQAMQNGLVSEAALYRDGNGDIYAGVYHYFSQSDGGVYLAMDDQPDYVVPVLPANVQVGVSWVVSGEYGDVYFTITQMGASCSVYGGDFDNCLVVEINNQVYGFQEREYWAPGMGLILRETIPNGEAIYWLTSYQKSPPDEAYNTLMQYSVNHSLLDNQLVK